MVAGENFQIFGENYLETYAPVISFELVRIFLYISLHLNMFGAQLDVKDAFLNGLLDEVIWVSTRKGIDGHPSCCYKLKRAMYGLKQAHLAWHKRLCGDLYMLGFHELPSAPCVFRLEDCSFGGEIFLLVYVDDILVLSSAKKRINFLSESIQNLYEARVSLSVDWFLGVKLRWLDNQHGRRSRLVFSQSLHIKGILRLFGMENAKSVTTPMVKAF